MGDIPYVSLWLHRFEYLRATCGAEGLEFRHVDTAQCRDRRNHSHARSFNADLITVADDSLKKCVDRLELPVGMIDQLVRENECRQFG
jgi:hypothetical protein